MSCDQRSCERQRGRTESHCRVLSDYPLARGEQSGQDSLKQRDLTTFPFYDDDNTFVKYDVVLIIGRFETHNE